MSAVVILITVIHIVVSLILIGIVLLQSGKSADLAATFGGAGSQAAFGPRGAATLLSKVTTWCAVVFMLTSITLSIFASRRATSTSVTSGERSVPTSQAPARTPTAPPATPSSPAPQQK
jgi:preprotein translocase subunit SecG